MFPSQVPACLKRRKSLTRARKRHCKQRQYFGISDFKPAASRQRLKESGTSNNAVVRVVHYAHAVTHAVPVSVRAFACLGLTKTLRLHQQLLRRIAAARRPLRAVRLASPKVTQRTHRLQNVHPVRPPEHRTLNPKARQCNSAMCLLL